MTLRLHHYLTILPLFLLLGAANAGLSAWLDFQEVTTSLEQESTILNQFTQIWPETLPLPETFTNPTPTSAVDRLDELEATLVRRAILFTLAALGAGLLVCEVLIFLNRRELGFLQKAADDLNEGKPVHRENEENIREYADLGSTLTTLSQILQENSQHTRSRLLHNDQKH